MCIHEYTPTDYNIWQALWPFPWERMRLIDSITWDCSHLICISLRVNQNPRLTKVVINKGAKKQTRHWTAKMQIDPILLPLPEAFQKVKFWHQEYRFWGTLHQGNMATPRSSAWGTDYVNLQAALVLSILKAYTLWPPRGLFGTPPTPYYGPQNLGM